MPQHQEDQSGAIAAKLDAVLAEVGQLRGEVGRLSQQVSSRNGGAPGPVVQHSSTTLSRGEAYDSDPLHHPAVLGVLNSGPRPGESEAAYRERLDAAKREAMRAPLPGRAGQPASPAQLEAMDHLRKVGSSHEQRRVMAEAQRQLDLTQAPIAPGGVMSRSPSGQVTVRFPGQLACENGHPAELPDQVFCMTCGLPVRTAEGHREAEDERAALIAANQRVASALHGPEAAREHEEAIRAEEERRARRTGRRHASQA